MRIFYFQAGVLCVRVCLPGLTRRVSGCGLSALMKVCMSFFRVIFAFFLVFLVSSGTRNKSWLYSANSGKQGEAFEAFVIGRGVSDLQFSLQDDSNTAISKNEGWFLRESVYATLVGIPSDLSPGVYKLVAEFRAKETDLRLEKPFLVEAVDYRQKDVRLSDKIARLFDSSSRRRKNEAVEFWSVISDFNPESVFHQKSLTLPVLTGRVTGQYGDRRRYIRKSNRQSESIHLGHDFAAGKGTFIFAAGGGRVVMARERIITGNTVIIEHLPGVHSLYYHMDNIWVVEGEVVKARTVLGSVGNTGFSTGNHLHWELRVGTVAVNPNSRLSVPLIDTNQLSDRM